MNTKHTDRAHFMLLFASIAFLVAIYAIEMGGI
jgi:hypothetical protein